MRYCFRNVARSTFLKRLEELTPEESTSMFIILYETLMTMESRTLNPEGNSFTPVGRVLSALCCVMAAQVPGEPEEIRALIRKVKDSEGSHGSQEGEK